MTAVVHRWTDGPVDFDGRTSLEDWVASLPIFEGRRPQMTGNGYSYLLRHMLAGGEVPYYTDPAQLLSDMHLAYANEVSELQRATELFKTRAAAYEPAIQRLWSLVFAADKRKTMRTDEVRAALEAGRG